MNVTATPRIGSEVRRSVMATRVPPRASRFAVMPMFEARKLRESLDRDDQRK